MTDRNHWKGTRIAMIGLGPHGEMVEDAKFLIKAGALLSVYDMKSEARLKSHLVYLRSIGLANYVCGQIPADDLLDADIVILSHEYPRDSTFLARVREKGTPIEYPETLFFKLAPPLTVVGIIGAAGKTSIISVLAPMLELASEKDDVASTGQNFFVCDPESNNGIICHLKKAKNGDILLIRITPRLIDELHELRVSPHVAIFAALPERYVKSPFEILEHQTYNNFLIASDEVIDTTRTHDWKPRAKMLRTKVTIIPPFWDLNIHEHNRMNIALALQVAHLFKVEDEQVKKIVETWKPPKGRIEFVKKQKGIEFYNDTASILPQSTISAMMALSKDRNLVLICGGSDTGVSYSELINVVPEYAHTVILLPGSGTMKHRKLFEAIPNTKVISAPGMEEAVRLARENAKVGDRVLFSPAFEASGYDISRKDRGERFVRAVRGL